MKNFKTGFAAALLASAIGMTVSLPGSALAQENDPVAFKVNGQEIRASEIGFARDEVLPHIGALPPKSRYPFIVDYLVERHLLAQAAVGAQINKTDAYRKRMRYYQVKALREAYFAEKIRPQITKEKVREVYEREKKNTQPRTRARALQIVVPTQQEADDLFSKVSKGENFGALARQFSKGEGANKGGDLGYFFKEEMVPNFSDVVFNLKPGQVGGPFQTKFGWHIVKLIDFQTIGPKRFEDVEEGVTAILLRQLVQDEIAKFKKRSKIEYLDPDLVKLREGIQKKLKEEADKQSKQ